MEQAFETFGTVGVVILCITLAIMTLALFFPA